MHLLITGAAGHIGRILMDGLPADWSLVGIDRAASDDSRILQAELSAVPDLGLDPADFDAVIHLAANADEAQPLAAHLQANVIGCETLLTWCAAGGARRILYASSCEAFLGRADDAGDLADNAPFAPRNVYGCTKIFGEMLCRMLTHTYGTDTLALRLGALLPPAMDADLADDEAYQAIRLPPAELLRAVVDCLVTPWSGAQAVFLGPQASTALPTSASFRRLFAGT